MPGLLWERIRKLFFKETLSEITLKKSTPTRFELARGDPNGFQVHRLNHSATVSDLISMILQLL
jgi:hypothetical protein